MKTEHDMVTQFPCPCCGFLTRSTEEHGTYEICPVCNWEDDGVQYGDPTFWGGANILSLNEAKENFKEFGASMKEDLPYVRSPLADEYPPDSLGQRSE
jgi:hypothetical protein